MPCAAPPTCVAHARALYTLAVDIIKAMRDEEQKWQIIVLKGTGGVAHRLAKKWEETTSKYEEMSKLFAQVYIHMLCV